MILGSFDGSAPVSNNETAKDAGERAKICGFYSCKIDDNLSNRGTFTQSGSYFLAVLL